MNTPMLRARVILLAGMIALGTGRSVSATETNATAHWAFQPLAKAPPLTVRNTRWPCTNVDRFILARLEQAGLSPSPDAEKRVLLRRVTFDLTGLPPTPAEMTSFLADAAPDAWSRVVERLLASPRYGERWGRHWMDVARYADTAGDNADYPVPEAALYRDYIIDAFNADKPYDEFVREQLAGDLLAAQGPPEKSAERIIATGFVALSRRYATAPFEFRHLIIEDTIETTGRAFLGMTFRCARCHDHKFDPVSREDYYGLYGFFASTRYPFAGSEEFNTKKLPRTGFVPLVTEAATAPLRAEQQRQLEETRAAIKPLEAEAESVKGNEAKKKAVEAKLKPLRATLKRLEMFGAPPGVPVAYAVTDDQAVDVPVQLRGEPEKPGKVVKRHFPICLGGSESLELPAGASGRLQLAEWITRPGHPLTARVMANRVWQHHFGKGLVATPSNFGLRGEPPTHPELLDYLARYLVEHDWSVKALHRLILNSAVWRQSSLDGEAGTKAAAATDPENRLHWRADRRRLDAESIRDGLLAAAGQLDLDRPGAHPFPRFEDWSWTQHNPFKAVYESNHRSVYLMRQRLQRHPDLALFDAPDANVSTDVRTSATVPPQALFLMNNKFVRTQAEGLARRVIAATPKDADRVRLAGQITWGRALEEPEVQRARDFLARGRQALEETGSTREKGEFEAWVSYARVLLSANEFFYVD